MISIQELGTTILSDKPNPFYVLGGAEHGVKDKYIDKLAELYGEKLEYPTVMSVIDMMNTRHLIPLKPTLYVVRYDESFANSVNATVATKIKKTKIVGTLVCIYNDDKQIAKIDKFLPECVGQIDAVNPKFIHKYLKSDFPKLDDKLITLAVKCGADYGHARTICKSLSFADSNKLAKMSEGSLVHLFGCNSAAEEKDIRLGVAARNFNYLIRVLSTYEGDKNALFYTILQTMIDMEKILTSKYSDLDIAEYKKFWKREDVYYMFMNTYNELTNSRSSDVSGDIDSRLTYLFALLTFKSIPSPEVMNAF